jgi:ATP-dependent 26S proteasome regulatory subunit
VHVQFPFPDEDERERLWRAHLPASLPVAGELDLAALAHTYQLSGGYIRNAALRAAYLAAGEGQALAAAHLHRAVALEYQRAGKLGGGRLE